LGDLLRRVGKKFIEGVLEAEAEQIAGWQGSDHRLRWVGSRLVFAESVGAAFTAIATFQVSYRR
jgi:hypothetical protein